MKNKKATINPINKKDNKCFQYVLTVTLNHEEIGKNPERITQFKPFIIKYKWEQINLPSQKDDWKKFKKNKTIGLNVLYARKEKICPAFVSKHNSNCEKQVILLMISNREKQWDYLAVKKTISIMKRNNFERSW